MMAMAVEASKTTQEPVALQHRLAQLHWLPR